MLSDCQGDGVFGSNENSAQRFSNKKLHVSYILMIGMNVYTFLVHNIKLSIYVCTDLNGPGLM